MLNDNDADIKIFADGSGLNKQAGAAAVLYRGNRPPKILRYHLRPLTQHTTTDSEGVGGILSMHLLQAKHNVTSVSVNIDNQSVISAIESCNIRKITLALRVLRVSQSISECLRVNWSVLKTITSSGMNKRPIGLKHIY
jgi:ribonuclease HI